MQTFSTKSELRAAGFTRGDRITYRGYTISSDDVTPGAACGENFAVVAFRRDAYFEGPDCIFESIDGQFAHSVTVYLTQERNNMRNLGCYSCGWYSAQAWADGVDAAKRAIDAYYESHPEAKAEQARIDAEREIITARQTAKNLRRQAIRRNRSA